LHPLQFANASIAFYETTKAGDAVAALKKSLKPEATVKRNGKWSSMEAALLVPGDLILLACGAAVPADCRVNDNAKKPIEVDQAQLTGESLPVTVYPGKSCMMGSTVVRGEVEATVEFTGVDTFFGKTATLLQGDAEISNLQTILLDIMIVLVFLSLTLCSIVFGYLVQENGVSSALSFVVVLMVASIPLAIEIVTTTTLALGSKVLAEHGAIVTRLSAIEDMAGMAILCSDKTGTLTLNKMEIQDYTPIYYQPPKTDNSSSSRSENDDDSDANKPELFNQRTLLKYAALAAKWEEPPKDALDTLVLNAVDRDLLANMELIEHMPFDPVVKRTEGLVTDNDTGRVFNATKGAPHVLLKLVNDHSVDVKVEADVARLGQRGIRCLAVAMTVDKDEADYAQQSNKKSNKKSNKSPAEDNSKEKWVFLGLLTFLDPPRPDTKQTIHEAREFGVAVKMITGDHLLIAKETARLLHLGEDISTAEGLPLLDPTTKQKPPNLSRDYGDLCLKSDGFAQVFPEHKYLIVECLRELGHKVGMTGDGVNDAPALKRADVGIAVSGATDAARAAADIVLTEPGLSTIIHGIVAAREIFARIRNFITYRIAATLQLLVFFFIAVFAFHPADYEKEDGFDDDAEVSWPEYFHMPVLMLMLITLLNDGTLISIAYDNVIPQTQPEVWNLRVLFVIGSVLGGVACISSLLLLWAMLDSWSESGVFAMLGIEGLSYGQITTAIYLKVSVSDFLTLYSSRTGSNWFWSSRPANILLAAGAVALSLSTVLACYWPSSYPDGIYSLGESWLKCRLR
jgi:H+-transporting ATPase